MLSKKLFEVLNSALKAVRRSSAPFGGVQLIFTGDFFQLPPVAKETVFAFQSPLWPSLNLQTIELTEIMRQRDPIFHQVLLEARSGKLSKNSIQILKGRMNESWQELKIRPTLVFSRRAEVEMINEHNIKALKGHVHYKAKTHFTASMEVNAEVQRAIEKLDRDAPYKTNLTLAVGAQVMLIYNLDQENGLVNGSRGIIEGFTGTPLLPLVLFKGRSTAIPIDTVSWESDEVDGLKRAQIPLILAYAVTIHKCQGATLDSALIDIGRSTFEMGQAYVALSRVKSLESLFIHDFEPEAFKANKKVLAFYDT
jgi:ATP-dependent DNA helicase PIF1